MDNFESKNQSKYPKGNPYIDKYRKEMSHTSYGVTNDMKFDPITGERINDVPKFDPQTGKPLTSNSPKFDPRTGLPVGTKVKNSNTKQYKEPTNIGSIIVSIIFLAALGVGIYFGAKNWDTISHDFLGEPYTITFEVENKTYTQEVKKDVMPEYTNTSWEDDDYVYKITGWDPEIEKANADTKYTAVVSKHDKVAINFNNVDGATLNNSLKFNPEIGLKLQSPSKDGYNFKGWYTTATFDESSKITRIEKNTNTEVTLYAKFEIISYEITYILNGSTLSGQITKYTISSADTALPTPIKGEKEFKGWTSNKFDGLKTSIPAGVFGDIELTAHFAGEDVSVKYYFGNSLIKEVSYVADQSFTLDTMDLGLTGYTIKGWYKDSALTQLCDYTTVQEDGMSLYAKVDYILDYGFNQYVSKFSQSERTQSNPLVIDSSEEFVAYVDYIYYNYIEDDIHTNASGYVKYNFNYIVGDITDFTGYIQNILKIKSYPSTITLNYTNPNSTTKIGFIGLTLPTNFKQIENQSEFTHSSPLKQYNIGVKEDNGKTRSSDFNDFKINKVGMTIECSSSDQLFYALEQGYRPVCVANSNAERIYNKAKAALRSAVNDDMTDIQKTKAIYEWLIENVEYDYVALNASENDATLDTYKYAAWALEGVFDKGYSVCDGISKAFVVLTRIEGIVSIRVTGDAHAWNKVYINNKWYGVDATHGNVGINDNNMTIIAEGITYTEFLFTDEQKADRDYEGDNFTQFVANTDYDFYNTYSLTNDLETIKFISGEGIDDGVILSYIYNQYKDYGHGTSIMIDVAIKKEDYEDDTFVSGNYTKLDMFLYSMQQNDAVKNKLTYKFNLGAQEMGDMVVFTFAYEIA